LRDSGKEKGENRRKVVWRDVVEVCPQIQNKNNKTIPKIQAPQTGTSSVGGKEQSRGDSNGLLSKAPYTRNQDAKRGSGTIAGGAWTST
jgi:hypothetical protein